MKASLVIVSIIAIGSRIGSAQQGNLEVSGLVQMTASASATPTPGTLRWTGADFQGFTGLFWLPITHNQFSAFPSNSGNGAKLVVDGAIQIGTTNQFNPKPGTIRWTGSDFQGWNGVFWVSLTRSSLVDVDGNSYRTVVIGTQEWMMENLRTSKYRDGVSIPEISENTDWGSFSVPGAFCWYNNEGDTYEHVYGKLYNWYAVVTDKLCPSGWRVPLQSDWIILMNLIGGASIAGGQMKEIGTAHWQSPNTGATNSSGFTGVPGGFRGFNGSFAFISQVATFWSRSADASGALYYTLNNSSSILFNFFDDRRTGASVRCIKE